MGDVYKALADQAVSQHLEVLAAAGLVTARREGRYRFHHLDTAPLRVVVERWLTDSEEDATRGSP